MREAAFELALCAHCEDDETVVARQLGGHVHGRRVVDAVLVEAGPGFDDRAAITDGTVPPAAVEADVGPGRWRDVRRVFPDRPPERRTDVVERAAAAGFFERERREGRTCVRQVARYPDDWFSRLVAVENKPDLDRPGDLRDQLRTDVSLGLFDAVVLATESYVTGAHLNRLPDAVGVWRFDPESGEREVVCDPAPLAADEGGVELLERHAGRTDVRPVSAAAKARRRLRVAERAYGKGWRPNAYPACAQVAVDERGVPRCRWKGRPVDPATDCGSDCDGCDPADPPAVDVADRRHRWSAWVRDPPGLDRRQAGLDRFG